MSQTNPNILVIVPAYNEREVIRKTLSELLAAGYKVLLIDDASTDAMAESVKDLSIHYIRHSVNLGQGAALMTGMTFAPKHDFDVVIHFDGDGQHRVEDIPTMLKPVLSQEADIVLGSRFLGEKKQAEIPWRRKTLLKIAIWVNALFTGLWLSDAHNGFRVLNRKAFSAIKLRENRMAHATEILSEIRRHHLKYMEVPVTIRYSDYARNKGQSGWNAFNILSDLILSRFL